MQDENSLSHTKWECKYHVVWIPKYRRKKLYGEIRGYLGGELKRLARSYGCEILEGHIMPDHIHALISIPPKISVSRAMGYIKGKSAIYIAKRFRGRTKNFTGENFWARGYYVSTVGRDEKMIREYIKNQEEEDKQLDLLNQ
ncbi:MAG: IS200/IS605 family transposase [Spirochaetaceae bacterium]|nr:IS200/IS605 family transposase [Spirochaetaceae bacterium]